MKLFDSAVRPHIAAIYGLVRVADEVVDTYEGNDQSTLLTELENETYLAIQRGYSTNPIVHAFAMTAKAFAINKSLIHPFFVSMHMDINPQKYDDELYKTYIHGSAEVVGLMCLKVFTNNDRLYASLETGARGLGAAYQKVNFLRDIKSDAQQLNRWYFPIGSFEAFDESIKKQIVDDIETDFNAALPAAKRLPKNAQAAVMLSIRYYSALLQKLKTTPADKLKRTRIRIPDSKKAAILLRAKVGL